MLLRLKAGDPFRARAYQKAAQAISEFSGDFDHLVKQKRLTTIKGIGQSLAAVIEELYATGQSSLLKKLRGELPPGVETLSQIPGLSIKKIKALYEALGITNLEELRSALEAQKVREVPGFGAKTEAALLDRISRHKDVDHRFLLLHAMRAGENVVDHMRSFPDLVNIDLAGSARRWKETVSSLRITAATRKSPEDLISHFVQCPLFIEIENRSKDGATGRLIDGMRVILSVAGTASYWNLLHYETGSRGHLEKLEGIAKGKGIELTPSKMKLTGKRLALKVESEADIYAHLDMQYIAPELREGADEIEMALAHSIPDDLITLKDINGMVHCHTIYSDGRNTIEQMARAAESMGMKYMTITDHSPSAHYANGVSLDRLQRQWEEISKVQEQVSIKLLRGTESDILADGSLDYPDNILEQFDVIIASIHSRFKLDEDGMTRRIIDAMKNPFFKNLGPSIGKACRAAPAGGMSSRRNPGCNCRVGSCD